MKITLRSRLFLAAFLSFSIAATALVQAGDPSKKKEADTPLELVMKEIGSANKQLGVALKTPDAAKKDEYVKLATTIKTEATKAKGLVPKKIAALPADKQGPELEAYKKDMDTFIAGADTLIKALEEARWPDADAALKVLRKEKSTGHERFQKD